MSAGISGGDRDAGSRSPRDEWQALGAQTRRSVADNARQGRAHPDPEVAAVALRYARAAGSTRPMGTAIRVRNIFGTLLVLAIVFLVVQAGRASVALGAVSLVLSVAALVVLVIGRRFTRPIARIGLVNGFALAVPEASEVSLSDPGGPAPGLAVRYVPRRAWQSIALLMVMLCCLGGLWWAAFWNASVPGQISATLLCGLLLVFAGSVMAAEVANLVGWVLPRRPVLVLDAGGIHVPRYSYTLSWPDLAEIRLLTRRSTVRRKGKPPAAVAVVAFVPADVAGAIASLRPAGRLRRLAAVYGTPLAFDDLGWEEPAERVATTAAAFTSVPVRRYIQ